MERSGLFSMEYAPDKSGAGSLTIGHAERQRQRVQALGFSIPPGNLLTFE